MSLARHTVQKMIFKKRNSADNYKKKKKRQGCSFGGDLAVKCSCHLGVHFLSVLTLTVYSNFTVSTAKFYTEFAHNGRPLTVDWSRKEQ